MEFTFEEKDMNIIEDVKDIVTNENRGVEGIITENGKTAGQARYWKTSCRNIEKKETLGKTPGVICFLRD